MMWEGRRLENGELHVIPLDDLRTHHETPNCWCTPSLDDHVYVHSSLDRRELYERGEKKPS